MPEERQYVALNGAPFSNEQAPAIGRAFERHFPDGTASTEEILNAAAHDPVLNEHFQWDDRKAAKSYRLHQARQLINHLALEISLPDGTTKAVRAFHSFHMQRTTENPPEAEGFPSQEKTEREKRYIHIQVVEERQELAEDLVRRAKNELDRWASRYSAYRGHFGSIFDAIEQINGGA